MSICSYITDITWEMMAGAGIDIDLVQRKPTETGTDEYVLIDGDVMVAFGPATTEQGNPAIGWEVSAYEREDGEWEHLRQEYAGTTAEALKLVASAVAFG